MYLDKMLGMGVMATIIIVAAISVLSSHYAIKTIVNRTSSEIMENMNYTSTTITKNMIALAYSQSKSSAENRKLELNKEGFEFADKLLPQRDSKS